MIPIVQPSSPSARDAYTGMRPEEYNPEMACAKLAAETAGKLGTPTIISKKFAVYHSIWQTLNHVAGTEKDPGNHTGYNCSLRVRLYNNAAEESVNIDGKFFERLWAYLMKPKYVISGTPYGVSSFDEQKPTIFQRITGVFTGKKPDQGVNGNNGS